MQNHNHSHQENNQQNILLAFFMNAGFAVIEFVGGYLTNSVAIYSDALHDLGDSIALLFAYIAEKISVKKADKNFTFGYRRFSVLAALVNGLILLIGSTFIIREAQKDEKLELILDANVIIAIRDTNHRDHRKLREFITELDDKT